MTQPTIEETLKERGSRYGEFDEHARITQNLKAAIADSPRWADLDDDMRECLEMVAHKIGRIVNGDPTYIDSWTDIIGYTRLVEKRLISQQQTAKIFAFPLGGASDHHVDALAGMTKRTMPAKTTAEVTEPTMPTKATEECDCLFCILEQAFGKQARA